MQLAILEILEQLGKGGRQNRVGDVLEKELHL